MLTEPNTNPIIENHLFIGAQSLRSFKKMIKRLLFPDWLCAVDIETAKEIINAHNDMGGDYEGTLELKIYSLECLILYTLNMYDLEDNLFEAAEDMFEEVLHLLTSRQEFVSKFKPRLEQLVMLAKKNYDCYEDNLEILWDKVF